MAKIVIEGSEMALKSFVDWLVNSGEQDFMEAWSAGTWDGKETIYPSTYISMSGYGMEEPIRLVEYDIATNEEVKYN
ncbi:hypothetical protein SEA1_gp0119 [Salmonella phage SEA1]|nr:hypothetical protein SEA1_gp0119 [Salmonella phage SEA1]